MAIRQDVGLLIFWKLGNFMAEMQGCHALKQFLRMICHFHEFHTAGVLVGMSCAVKVKKKLYDKFSM